MLKNNKGISLITVLVTIVIMSILIYIVVNSSINSVSETNITKINNEIKNLKNAISVRISNNERNENLYPMVGNKLEYEKLFEQISSIKNLSSGEVTTIVNKYNAETQDYFRLIGKIDAEKLGVEGKHVGMSKY